MDSKGVRAKAVHEGRKLKEVRYFNLVMHGADPECEKEACAFQDAVLDAKLISGDMSGTESDDSGLGQLFGNDACSLYSSTDDDEPHFTAVALGSKVSKADAWFKEGHFSFNVTNINGFLIKLEDGIVHGLLERGKFCYNKEAYDKKSLPVTGFEGPLVKFMLKETESVCAKIGRYVGGEEFPYFLEVLSDQVLVSAHVPNMILHPGSVSVNPNEGINEGIWNMYFDKILPKIVHGGSDGLSGSSAALDVSVLQALSKRTHYAKFLAEAKFQELPEYKLAIVAEDKEALELLLNFPEPVEISARRAEIRSLIQPDVAVELYDNWLLPMTKEVQLQYLLHRLNAA